MRKIEPHLLESLTLKPADQILVQELDGEAVLLHLPSGQYFGLDEVGTRIWALLQEGLHGAALLQTLLDEYEVTETECRAHVAEFLESLAAAGLVEIG